MNQKAVEYLNVIAQAIYDKKGINILGLNVSDISTMSDYVVIAEGNIDRHVKALSRAIRHALEPLGLLPMHVDGEKLGDWVVMDYGETVIHLFTPNMRERYELEELWRQAAIIDFKIIVRSTGEA